MAASELLCRAHSSSAQRSRPPVTSPRRLHPARGGRHHPWVTATAPVPAAAVAARFDPPRRPAGLIAACNAPRAQTWAHTSASPNPQPPAAAAAVPVAPASTHLLYCRLQAGGSKSTQAEEP
eukprot:CAMPEP_0185354808 /NCGR_PEP_ID=MMETSP1364-20130426/5532_1 /TAXON_ID=38817 /ORGANISM="Gephyrocapsa oceanica, Strain RCC1303" /LENGTH=121 /DNA_ID=CAMNT_0027954545 /DNA_START=312 /DNA_END=678 /DNA_ORIENTATION=-